MSKRTPKRSSGARTLLEDQLDAAVADRLGVAGIDPLAGDPLAQLDHVFTFVAVLGQLLAAHASDDRGGEAIDLTAGVVDVELALHLVSGGLEQADQGVAVGRVATAADVQRAGRVGGDELDQDALGRGRRRRAETRSPAAARLTIARRYHSSARKRLTKPGPATSIRSTVSGPSCSLELDGEPGGDVARVFAQRRGEQHRRVGAVVAQLRLGRPFQRRLRTGRLAVAQRQGGAVHRGAELGDRIGGGSHRAHRMEGGATLRVT